MSISKELFLAILSMDAYNRGYGAGIADGGKEDTDGLGESGQIGTATIIKKLDDVSSSFRDEAKTAGFYAIAYSIDATGPEGLANKTVLAYRGTDNPSTSYDADYGGSDAVYGWVMGEGTLTAQSYMSLAGC